MNLQIFSYSNRLCIDTESPIITCPGLPLYVNTAPGKATAEVEWSFQVTDNSLDVDPNAVIQVESSHKTIQEFPIGYTLVRINAADQAGNMATCGFGIRIKGN